MVAAAGEGSRQARETGDGNERERDDNPANAGGGITVDRSDALSSATPARRSDPGPGAQVRLGRRFRVDQRGGGRLGAVEPGQPPHRMVVQIDPSVHGHDVQRVDGDPALRATVEPDQLAGLTGEARLGEAAVACDERRPGCPLDADVDGFGQYGQPLVYS